MTPRAFASDNNAGVHPEVLPALPAANAGHAGPLHAQFDGELREVAGTMNVRLEAGSLPVLIAA